MAKMSAGKLKIAVNAQMFAEKGVGGIETVLVGLVNALGKLDGPEEYVLIGPWENPEWLNPYSGPNQRSVRGPRIEFAKRAAAPLRPVLHRARRLLQRTAGVSPTWPVVRKSDGFYEQLGCDVIYFPSPQFVKCSMPSVYNVHDLQHLHYPDFFSREGFIWRERIFRAGCELAHTVVAISECVKQDLMSHYHMNQDRVQVIYWGPPTQVHDEPSDAFAERTLQKHSLRKPFAFFPSMTRIHKNHIGLLEAVAALRDQSGLKLDVVCTGYKHEFWATIEQRMRALNLQDQVKFIGMVEPMEVRALYRSAEFVVFPSLFEGAGMPLLEAWKDDAPITCSAVTSLPELAADAALLFDPTSTSSIAGALARMHNDIALRDDLRRRGAERLKQFSWETTAKRYRAVFRSAAGRELDEEDRWFLTHSPSQSPVCNCT
jgi:glycosyltransferase involved in cell wall biosynthesis